MAARTSMATIITRVRSLIYDTAGGSQVFTDDTIQDTLDARRQEQRFRLLRGMPSFQAGGAVLFLDFYADVGAWEDDILLQDASFATVSPSLSENIVGHWQFNTQPSGFAVHATGKTYDVYGSAADLLESWGAQVKLDFSFTSNRDAINRNQKFDMLMALAKQYRAQALVQTSPISQREIASDVTAGPGVTYTTYGDSDAY